MTKPRQTTTATAETPGKLDEEIRSMDGEIEQLEQEWRELEAPEVKGVGTS